MLGVRSQRRSASVYARCMASVSALELERVAPAAAGAGSTRSSESTTLLTMLVPTLPTQNRRGRQWQQLRISFPLNLYMCTGYTMAV